MTRLSNDSVRLVPRTEFDGPALELDFPGLRIGVAEYEAVCGELKIDAGLVDLATLCVVNLFLGGDVPAGDWLVVHLRPESTSIPTR